MISEAGVRVPYLVYWKGTIPAQTYNKPLSTMDAGATAALALAGIKTQKNELDGVNLMPYLTQKDSSSPHEYLYWRFWGQSAIRTEKWKYFELENGVEMLFDMNDPLPERKNLIKQYPEVASHLQKKLSHWRDQQKRQGFVEKFGREAKWFQHYFKIKIKISYVYTHYHKTHHLVLCTRPYNKHSCQGQIFSQYHLHPGG